MQISRNNVNGPKSNNFLFWCESGILGYSMYPGTISPLFADFRSLHI